MQCACEVDDKGRIYGLCGAHAEVFRELGTATKTLGDTIVRNDTMVRKFDTGASRSADATRDDPEGYFSPLAIDRVNEYMTKHRKQPDGSIRDSDNWQKGIPLSAYMKGMWRHMLHAWTRHRGHPVRDAMASADLEEDLAAIIFNAQGYLHELVKKRINEVKP